MDTPTPPAVPRPAATVLLVRDGPQGIEVFMAARHQGSSFMPGVLVFPGGGVDRDDAEPALVKAAWGDAQQPEDAISRIAAVREVFEESGFLLARSGDKALDAETYEWLLARYRAKLCANEIAFSAMMAEEGLTPAVDAIVPFARWITPIIRAKRFDARFYIVRAPDGQTGLHDEQELVSSHWTTPADALGAAERGEVKIVFVTRSNLRLLAKSRTVDEALAAARARKVVPVQPELFDRHDGPALRIPAEAGYDVTEILVRDVGD